MTSGIVIAWEDLGRERQGCGDHGCEERQGSSDDGIAHLAENGDTAEEAEDLLLFTAAGLVQSATAAPSSPGMLGPRPADSRE
jgi:hypothetical protein